MGAFTLNYINYFRFCLNISFLSVCFYCFSATECAHATGEDESSLKDGAPMILVQGGDFIMGDDSGELDERPVHRVFIDAFYIDEHEVTVRQYEKYLNATGRTKPLYWQPEYDNPNDPVVGVSWQDAADYARWADKRLPTEAEWEYAARGGNLKQKYPWGDKVDPSYANYNSFGLLPVKSLKPNTFGIYDMIGNVWEWCSDWYDGNYYAASSQKNPTGPVSGTHKVLRGGAWYCDEREVRVANRYYALPDAHSFNIGFRCVRSVK